MSRPIKTAILYTGYVETESHAGLILTHRKGFKSLKDVINSLANAFSHGWATQLQFDYVDSDTTLQNIVYDYIRGDNQSGDSEVWQALEDEGWTSALPKNFGRFVHFDRADEILSKAYEILEDE